MSACSGYGSVWLCISSNTIWLHHVKEAQLLILDVHIYGQKLQISPKTAQNGHVNGFKESINSQTNPL